FTTAVSIFLDRLVSDAAFEFVCDPSQSAMAERYGRQRGQRLEGDVHIQFQATGGHIVRLVRQWCDAVGRELVRVAKRQRKGRDELLRLTNQMAIYSRPGEASTLVAHYINDNPPA